MNLSDLFTQILNIFSASGKFQSNEVLPIDSAFDGTDLQLKRYSFTQYSTQGELFIEEQHQAWTIECPKESYEGSHVCIPVGTYVVKLIDSPKHGPNTPELQDVPGRTYIEMHSSNYAIDPDTKQVFLLGCIAPGTSKDLNVVYNSKVAMAAIMQKIDWTKPVRIVVTEI